MQYTEYRDCFFTLAIDEFDGDSFHVWFHVDTKIFERSSFNFGLGILARVHLSALYGMQRKVYISTTL